MTTAPPEPLVSAPAHSLITGPAHTLISVPAEGPAIAPAQTDYHHASHRDLLKKPKVENQRRVKIDAIIVPTVRPPANLMDAAQLAIALGCPLVTLHSGRYTSALAAARRLPAKTDRIAIDVPDRASLRLPEFATSSILTGTKFDRPTDTSPKRNIGLMLCHMLGWKHVVFLDDDIEIPDPVDLELAAGLLDTHNIVGLFVDGFPDNSVVCHAYRIAGGPQKSFIGGGAIVVETERTCSFFPDIYNDDWFYMLDDATGLQPVATTGTVKQRYYDPFAIPTGPGPRNLVMCWPKGCSGCSTRAGQSRTRTCCIGRTSWPAAERSSTTCWAWLTVRTSSPPRSGAWWKR